MARRTRHEIMQAQAERSFIGREDVLLSFQANISSDEPPRVLFAIAGEGGVGKSSMLDQLERDAAKLDVSVLIIRCDERQPFPVDVISQAAERLSDIELQDPKANGRREQLVKELKDRLVRHARLRRDIESDDDAPDVARKLVGPVASGGVRAARHLPAVGAVAELVDPERTGAAAGELVSYLRRRGRSEDDIRLAREPEQVLTPLLLDAVNAVAIHGWRVILFCDVFERTGSYLEGWLLETLRSDHGNIDPLFVAVVAGREELGQAFTGLGVAVSHVQLEPFTREETQRYLTQRDISDKDLVDVIHRDTAGLPVLVELVASRNPQPGQPLPDVSKDAVRRFLSWIDDPKRRSACLYAAVPRWFDAEVLGLALPGRSGAGEEFDWLQHEAFVRRPSSSVPGSISTRRCVS